MCALEPLERGLAVTRTLDVPRSVIAEYRWKPSLAAVRAIAGPSPRGAYGSGGRTATAAPELGCRHLASLEAGLE